MVSSTVSGSTSGSTSASGIFWYLRSFNLHYADIYLRFVTSSIVSSSILLGNMSRLSSLSHIVSYRLPLLTAGCYTLFYSVRFRERDTFDYYDSAPSTPVKSCCTGRSNRRGRHGNRNHIWWSCTYTKTKDNSDTYCRWNQKHKRWEYNDKYKYKKTLTPPAATVEHW